MRRYKINKGVMKPLEFLGLRAQYIVLLFAGFIVSFLAYFVISFINSYAALAVCAACVLASAGSSFYLNSRYSRHGLTFAAAARNCCRHIRNDRRLYQIIEVK